MKYMYTNEPHDSQRKDEGRQKYFFLIGITLCRVDMALGHHE